MQHERIVSDPKIMFGKPTIRGTRLTVELILRELGLGADVNELIEDYPTLTYEDIAAARIFAADYIRGKKGKTERSTDG